MRAISNFFRFILGIQKLNIIIEQYKSYISELETKEKDLIRKNKSLELEVKSLKSELSTLKRKITNDNKNKENFDLKNKARVESNEISNKTNFSKPPSWIDG